MAAIGKSRDLGTMQKSDLEFVGKNIYDPSGTFAGITPGIRSRSIGATRFTTEKLNSGLEQLARQHPELFASPEAGAWRNYVAQFQESKKARKK